MLNLIGSIRGDAATSLQLSADCASAVLSPHPRCRGRPAVGPQGAPWPRPAGVRGYGPSPHGRRARAAWGNTIRAILHLPGAVSFGSIFRVGSTPELAIWLASMRPRRIRTFPTAEMSPGCVKTRNCPRTAKYHSTSSTAGGLIFRVWVVASRDRVDCCVENPSDRVFTQPQSAPATLAPPHLDIRSTYVLVLFLCCSSIP
jgi:hypothetical protein